jgi:hypothetical protein
VQPAPKGLLDNANFGALTPDGKKILTMGNPQCTAGSDTFPRKSNTSRSSKGRHTRACWTLARS